jgi:hypothetical protein
VGGFVGRSPRALVTGISHREGLEASRTYSPVHSRFGQTLRLRNVSLRQRDTGAAMKVDRYLRGSATPEPGAGHTASRAGAPGRAKPARVEPLLSPLLDIGEVAALLATTPRHVKADGRRTPLAVCEGRQVRALPPFRSRPLA